MYSARKLATNDKFIQPGGINISKVKTPQTAKMTARYRDIKGWTFTAYEALMLTDKMQEKLRNIIDERLDEVC